jgi:hypothetical protein
VCPVWYRQICSANISSLDRKPLLSGQLEISVENYTIPAIRFSSEKGPTMPDKTDWNLRYRWHQLVSEVLKEPRLDNLPRKVNAAARAISARVLDPTPARLDERIALKQALRDLRALIDETAQLNPEEQETTIA